jgi:hypothetical protein
MREKREGGRDGWDGLKWGKGEGQGKRERGKPIESCLNKV